jgi:hypothetical protein
VNTNDDYADFDFGILGREWWLDAGETTKATPTQIKFACARHAGATRTRAAELAGYSASDPQSLRTAGSRADDTKSVADMLVMASAAAVSSADEPYTVAEARAKIGRMVKTSLDPNVCIKGCELLAKLDQVDRDRGQTPEDDGLSSWRIERDFLIQRNGAVAYVLMHGIAGRHLLHDTYSLCMQQEFGPEIWSRLYAKLNDGAREQLDRNLANPKYQAEVRKTIWAEGGCRQCLKLSSHTLKWGLLLGPLTRMPI